MNKIFSFDRFWKYFKYDLVNAKSNFGLSMLILGFLPIMVYVVANLFSMVFTGSWIPNEAGTAFGGVAMGATFTISCIILGVKLYGNLTDKKAGSNWIMIPASTFEKFLSMFLIVFIIVPVCLAAMLLVSDLILSLLPGYTSVTSWINKGVSAMADNGLKVKYLPMIWLMWGQYALAFLLGAIIFKKAKVGKTILWMFIIGTVSGIVFTKILGLTDMAEHFMSSVSEASVSGIQSRVNWWLNISWFGWVAVLAAGIFWRLKTIKH